MAEKDRTKKEIELLTNQIEKSPSAALYIERGRLLYKIGEFGEALNDFIRANEREPENAEAIEMRKILEDIFEYRYTDYYNP